MVQKIIFFAAMGMRRVYAAQANAYELEISCAYPARYAARQKKTETCPRGCAAGQKARYTARRNTRCAYGCRGIYRRIGIFKRAHHTKDAAPNIHAVIRRAAYATANAHHRADTCAQPDTQPNAFANAQPNANAQADEKANAKTNENAQGYARWAGRDTGANANAVAGTNPKAIAGVSLECILSGSIL